MKAVFFSDAHLGREDHQRSEIIGRFIREVSRDADLVVIVGDLFEFYHGYDDFVYPWFRAVVETLKEAAAGRRLYFVEGNHEFALGSYFSAYTGATCADKAVFDLDGKKVFVAHGDHLESRLPKPILKSCLIYVLMDLFRPRLTWRIAMGCRRFLSRKRKVYDERVLNKFRGYGRNKLRTGYDAVVLAHSHMPDILTFQEKGREKVYVNTGDLIENFSYCEYTSENGFQLRSWAGPSLSSNR